MGSTQIVHEGLEGRWMQGRDSSALTEASIAVAMDNEEGAK